ncbi:MAG TPA: ABC transporter permease [Chloroflexi bacterium]|jgi:simple sugar transport system permease protein|nr:ABC transporter permease [Chloroflexota bacterium]HAL27388.1 ABC transporter permease [Chloroflexota bacterium]
MLVGASVLAATLRLATPIALAALGGTMSERSGVVNIALEGSMLVGCFFGVVVADRSHNIWLALAAALLAGLLLAALHAYASITLRADQIVSGMALNILALGLTTYLDYEMYGTTGTPSDLVAVPDLHLTFLNGIPYVGTAIGDQNWIVWVGLLLVAALQVFLFRTVLGLRWRAVGEHPRAAETVGVNVRRMRYAAVLASGALAALGGAYLSLGVAHSFTDGMTGGRGFIGLAAMIFGRWTPVGALGASLIFGYGNALSTSLQGATVGGVRLPVQLLGTLPYILTILAVAGFVGRSRAPAADGLPYETEGHA